MRKYSKKTILLILVLSYLIAPLSSAQAGSGLCVSGVVVSQENPLAVINAEVARVGDIVEGATVRKINNLGVEFEYEGNIFFRNLNEGCGVESKPFYQEFSEKAFSNKQSYDMPQTSGNVTPQQLFAEQKLTLSKDQEKAIISVIAGMMGVVLLVVAVLYIYKSLTLQLIANKTDTPNSWLAWIPIADLYLVCVISGKPAWWLLLLFIPLVNFVFWIVVWVGIAEVRKKPNWLGILMILPVVNLITLGYLAFSKKVEAQEAKQGPKIKVEESPKPETKVVEPQVVEPQVNIEPPKSEPQIIEPPPQTEHPKPEPQNIEPEEIEPNATESESIKPDNPQPQGGQ